MGRHVRAHVLHAHDRELLLHLRAHAHVDHNANAVFHLDERYNFRTHGYARVSHTGLCGCYKKYPYNHGHKSKTNQH
ncbi:Uncharacterised protein [Acinetobacter baumannii]|nr:Uncharacterised protein [Acinetobacter baumannii]SSQ43223.1 Uncharacterised protein [Acinetobacter baumannii]SVK02417.1 Uncharacterised protein [Acinetobacter baumannii]